MCLDPASMQWAHDFAQHKPKPTNTVPGITYMLAGATQRSDSDPYDTTSPPIKIGPHWMIMWPFDPESHWPAPMQCTQNPQARILCGRVRHTLTSMSWGIRGKSYSSSHFSPKNPADTILPG